MKSILKKCPCGKIPNELHIVEKTPTKWMHVCGNCCDEWLIEFRTHYEKPGSDKLMQLAIEAWNNAERDSEINTN